MIFLKVPTLPNLLNCSNEKLLEEANAVVAENLVSENRDKPLLIAVSGKSGESGTLNMDENEWFSIQILLYKCEVFH